MKMNENWAAFKAHGIAKLGRRGFAHWLKHASEVMAAEADVEDRRRAAKGVVVFPVAQERVPLQSFDAIVGGA